MHLPKKWAQPHPGFLFADITDSSTQKFAFVVNLVKQESVDSLVEKLRVGPFISKETVIDDSELSLYPSTAIPPLTRLLLQWSKRVRIRI